MNATATTPSGVAAMDVSDSQTLLFETETRSGLRSTGVGVVAPRLPPLLGEVGPPVLVEPPVPPPPVVPTVVEPPELVVSSGPPQPATSDVTVSSDELTTKA